GDERGEVSDDRRSRTRAYRWRGPSERRGRLLHGRERKRSRFLRRPGTYLLSSPLELGGSRATVPGMPARRRPGCVLSAPWCTRACAAGAASALKYVGCMEDVMVYPLQSCTAHEEMHERHTGGCAGDRAGSLRQRV